jgi:hypothetical protein
LTISARPSSSEALRRGAQESRIEQHDFGRLEGAEEALGAMRVLLHRALLRLLAELEGRAH